MGVAISSLHVIARDYNVSTGGSDSESSTESSDEDTQPICSAPVR